MKNHTCGFLAQHFWELPPPYHAEGSTASSVRERLKKVMLTLIQEAEVTRFVVMMERGFPLDAAAAVLELRSEHPITLECVIPFEEQHIAWPEEVRERYFSLIAQCDSERMLQRAFTLDCYQSGIKYLFSCCERFLVVWNGKASDAGDCVRFARRKRRTLRIIDPKSLHEIPKN